MSRNLKTNVTVSVGVAPGPQHLFMEHIIKQTDLETIKRFELSNRSIWVVKKGDNFGVAETKKKAEIDATNNMFYAFKGTPDFINEIGSYHKYNSKLEINSIPGALSFIWSKLPLAWHSKYLFRVIVKQDLSATYLEIASIINPDLEPMKYSSDFQKGFHAQLLNCIYQFYIDQDKPDTRKKQHPKLAEWQKNWYSSKLVPRKI